MNRKFRLGLGVLLGLAILVGFVGVSQAAFQVTNTAQLVYFSNVYAAYSYSFTDTAAISVLFGPQMYVAKNVRNDVTGDSSANQVPAGKGDTVTFFIYAANDQPQADTAAWHVIIFDTFTYLVGTTSNASVGETAATCSFTYVPGSETIAYSGAGETVAVSPNYITYYIDGTGWLGNFDPSTQTRTGTWYTYDAARESAIAVPGRIQGIKWYWTYVPSDKDALGASTGLPYVTKVKYSLKKNNN